MVIKGKVTQRQGLRGGISVMVQGDSGQIIELSGLPKNACTDLVLGNDVEITVTASAVVAPAPVVEEPAADAEYSNDE